MPCNNHCENIEIKNVKELPIDRTEQVPDYFFTIQTKINPTDGTVLYQPLLTPGNAIFPNGNQASTFTIPANNNTLVIPDGQVVPCYIENTGTASVVMKADENHPAHFLAIGVVNDSDLLVCQSSGAVQLLSGHQYTIGVPYYRASKAGEVTTDPTQTGQRLFTPISRYQLNCEFTW